MLLSDYFLIVLSVLLGVVVILMSIILRKSDKTWKDFFKPYSPRIPIKINKKELDKVVKQLQVLSAVDRLYILRHVIGSSYKAIVRINSKDIQIEGIGAYVDMADEELEEFTG